MSYYEQMMSILAIDSDPAMIASYATYFPNTRIQATASNFQYQYITLLLKTPDYQITAPQFVFPGFILQVADPRELNLGNDYPIEAAYLEVTPGNTTTQKQLKFNGNSGGTIPNGSFLANDADNSIVIPASTWVRLKVAFGQIALNAYYPSGAFYIQEGWVEGGSANAASRATLVSTNYPTAAAGFNTGATYGPCMLLAKGWKAAGKLPVALAVGDSICFGDADTQSVNAVDRVFGYVGNGLYSSTGGRVPFANFGIPGSRFSNLVETNTTDAQGGFAKRAAILRAFNYPYTSIVCEMGINTVANAVGADATAKAAFVVSQAQASHAYLKTLGGRNLSQTTLTHQTTAQNESGTASPGASNYLMWSSGNAADQFKASSAEHIAMDNYFTGTPTNVDSIIDIRSYMQIDSGSGAGKWKAPGTTYTLQDNASSGQKFVSLDAAPTPGDVLVFEPGTSAQVEGGIVVHVTGTGPYTVEMKGNLTKTHLITSTAKESYTLDGTHPSKKGHALAVAAMENAKTTGKII